MKIVSRLKDFWDFAAGFDTDGKKVYVRDFKAYSDDPKELAQPYPEKFPDFKQYPRQFDLSLYDSWNYGKNNETIRHHHQILHFCGEVFGFVRISKSSGQSWLGTFKNEPDQYFWSIEELPECKLKQDLLAGELQWERYRGSTKDTVFCRGETCINEALGEPIVLGGQTKYGREFTKDVLLKDIGFHNVLDAITVYQKVYNFVKYPEPDTTTDPTDMGRYESKGFDKKHSFRNTK